MQDNNENNNIKEENGAESSGVLHEPESTAAQSDGTGAVAGAEQASGNTESEGNAVEVTDADDEELAVYVPKLTEKQQKIWQTIIGIACGFVVWFSLALGSADPDNSLLRWLFLIVFVVIMVIRSQIEKRTGIILRTFIKFFLIGLIIFLGVYVIYGLASGTLLTQQ